MSITILQRELKEVELKDTLFDKYLDFMKEVFETRFKNYLEYTIKSTYNMSPCLLVKISQPPGASTEVLILAAKNPKYSISGLHARHEILNEISQIIELYTYFFIETEGFGHVYFIYVPGQPIIPLRQLTRKHKIVERLFFENMIYLFVFSMLISVGIYLLLSAFIPLEYLPIAIILSQTPLIIFAPQIIEALTDWVITRDFPLVVIVDISLPFNEYDNFVKNIFNKYKYEIKREIYNVISKNFTSEENSQKIASILEKYGASVDPLHIKIRITDLYSLVTTVFEKYNLKVPKIILSNIIIPNAAASGVLSSNSVLLITSGLLVKLNDEEIMAVIGHEASHMKNKDPLIFYLLSSVEYLTRVYILTYILFPLLLKLGVFFELVYLYISLTALFFVAKFLETRADIESAVVLGKGSALAAALKKIGLRRLLREIKVYGRTRSWLLWDPHPPIAFRITLLEKINQLQVKNPWIFSIKYCLKDFIKSLTV
ncbi:MAG: hypothetical protein DRN04_01150 [Thermoprotei archaeon]|nr:MAG: hypothetical protein DRN04_01150 [Thermoprotei archaeon]